ncbi:hypothetical protein FA13DRAFT_1820541 [Coprinellus micaceus]|uniref:Uncharacterized protein n=1 Tax=Coprinellus micaceus TaxID=71717 RepID=A0A4Y7SEJ1_COPMI|nr:hypothetical protein FA13DRAFT_1820541 [Coprinellus micaceus]
MQHRSLNSLLSVPALRLRPTHPLPLLPPLPPQILPLRPLIPIPHLLTSLPLLPELEGAGDERRSTMSADEEQLGEELSKLTREFPNHLVIYAGVPTQELRARQASVSPLVEAAAAAKKHRTGILHTYQILTPGLITVLLVVFFILVPALMLGINALAGIQNMVKLKAPKGYDARERKNQ